MPLNVIASHELLSPICQGWLGKIRESDMHKRPFNDVAQQCMSFYAGAVGFMYESDFMSKFIGSIPAPRFKITLNKAFELIALFGPTLYWRNPVREVKPRRRETLGPEIFGQDPQLMQMFQQFQPLTQQMDSKNKILSSLLSTYLNYTPTEQPQGLAYHAEQCITEALVKGRSCLWVKPFQSPESSRVLTGCFHDTVDNLLLDPDATSIHDAKWIAQRVHSPVWEAEREFGLPKGSLKGKGTFESAWSQGETDRSPDEFNERRMGHTNDSITYFKVYSKNGAGGRLKGMYAGQEISEALERVVGDYAYVVVSPNVPYPLNAPTEWMRSATDDEIKERFSWPIPYYMDSRWPVAVLDFYTRPNDPWPIAPLAPGLGELTVMNLMLASLTNQVYEATRTILVTKGEMNPQNEAQLKSGADFSHIKLDNIEGNIDDLVKFIQYPTMNPDAWTILDRHAYNFDRRTGLTELMSGLRPGGKVTRVAEDASNQKQQMSIRPEYMAGKVEDFLTEASDMEKMCARWYVPAQSLQGLMGPWEQYLWQQYVLNDDPEYVVRELQATVMANSARRPDKKRDAENLQGLMQTFAPVLKEYSFGTGNFEPLNHLLRLWSNVNDQDVSEMLMQPPPQQEGPDPEAQAAQAEQERQVAEFQAKMQQDQQTHQSSLMQKGQTHQQKMGQSQQTHEQKMEAAGGNLLADRARFRQDFFQDDESHDQELSQKESMGKLQLQLAKRASTQNGKKEKAK